MTASTTNRPAARVRPASLANLLNGPRVRRTSGDGHPLYAAVDVVAELTDDVDPAARATTLKAAGGPWSALWESATFDDGTTLDALPAVGVVHLVWELDTPQARRYRAWAADAAAAATEPSASPTRWDARRADGVGSRHDLTGEWAARGAGSSDDYRELTNGLFRAAFDADVAGLRAVKGLTDHPGENLRDHMTDVELLLTMLAETAAVALARRRDARGMEQLREVVTDAGRLAAVARRQLAVP